MICGFPHQHLNGVYWMTGVWRTAESRSMSKRRDSGEAVVYWRRAAMINGVLHIGCFLRSPLGLGCGALSQQRGWYLRRRRGWLAIISDTWPVHLSLIHGYHARSGADLQWLHIRGKRERGRWVAGFQTFSIVIQKEETMKWSPPGLKPGGDHFIVSGLSNKLF